MNAIRNRKRTPLVDRFWKYTQITDNCWIWTGKSRAKFGYGLINTGGHNGKIERAHRVSWMLHFGEIPTGMCVCHTCDNPLCVRPDHLFLGTREDNNHDMQRKQRYDHVKRAKGEHHGMAKLTSEQVIEMRKLYTTRLFSLRNLAEKYAVSIQSIHRIIHRKSWKHI